MISLFAQIVVDNWPTMLFGYGPLGGISWWLARQVEKLTVELRKRDIIVREITDKHADAMKVVAHKLSGMSRALIYNAATHGPDNIKILAHKELQRMDKNTGRED